MESIVDTKNGRRWKYTNKRKIMRKSDCLRKKPHRSLSHDQLHNLACHQNPFIQQQDLQNCDHTRRLLLIHPGGSKIHFCRWWLCFMHDGLVKPKLLFFFSDKAWLHYVGVPTLRTTVNGVQRISVSCINIPFTESTFKSGMKLPITDQ